ncbi:aspartate kinase [Vicingus serpentipes]|uniref:Aspartokinase n=1 Tax=Vicingus serpentipes TaxID=1926625 RepID=A0A5C6RY34_9FLAO|nr:aspartate kinase [Vicingus serpentipes]TXB67171.1 aspartate kinase [Vicingus serpentipes]
MKVFKFGGASVKNAESVKNVAKVIQLYSENLIIVISAMGKTTNALEKVVESYMAQDGKCFDLLNESKDFHFEIMNELFADKSLKIFEDIHNTFVEIEWEIEDAPTRDFNYVYDQIVSVGELLSTKIVSAYLNSVNINTKWIDARDLIQTDNTHRDARIDWELTESCTTKTLAPLFNPNENTIIITQGFIGSSSELFTTTLGREGSDFSAGILAYCMNADSVTIWKDVPGMLNADPKWFDNTQKLSNISYHEAVELAYYGATVIHPKTIKPLQNKKIPLYVKSFVNPKEEGSIINQNTAKDAQIPSFIFKMNQMLISIGAKDYSFIMEDHLSHIFGLFAKHNVKINLMQNSAISFSIVTDNDKMKIPNLIEELKGEYKVLFNENLELVTIRHYDQQTIDRVTNNKTIIVEQKSRNTARMVMKNN